jgi:hypothetical protein
MCRKPPRSGFTIDLIDRAGASSRTVVDEAMAFCCESLPAPTPLDVVRRVPIPRAKTVMVPRIRLTELKSVVAGG